MSRPFVDTHIFVTRFQTFTDVRGGDWGLGVRREALSVKLLSQITSVNEIIRQKCIGCGVGLDVRKPWHTRRSSDIGAGALNVPK